MNETQQLPISIQPIINYPRAAKVGKTYLMEIDIKQTGDFDKWNYEEEEYPIYCRVDTYSQGDTTPLFKIKIIGEPAVILHRFGGTYGAAKFLLTAAQKEMKGEIRVTLVNGWGVPLKRLRLEDVAVVTEISDDPVIAGFKVISQSTPSLQSFEFETEVNTIIFEEKLKYLLLVEDEQEVIQEVSKILSSQYEITVRGTDSVNEVIELAESGEIDLILINYGLPNSRYQNKQVNGFETIRILKANSNVYPSLPIVGFSGGEIANDFIASGADGFYSKRELLESGNYQKFVDYLEKIFHQVIENIPSKPGKNYAIAIGINQYNYLPTLRYAVTDAEEIKARCEFQNFSKVDLFPDVTSVRVKEFFAEQFEKPFLSAKDNLWFFFSGHSRLRQGVDYLMLVDSKTDEITETAISLNSLVEQLFSSGAGKVILYLDMDRLSGESTPASSSPLSIKDDQGLIVFYACEPNTAAYEIEQLQQGSFSYALYEALLSTKINFSINQLEKFLSDRVPELNQQNNQRTQAPQTFISPNNLREWVPFPSDFQVFQYTTPTVNRRGEIIKQNTKLAQYFTETLPDGIELEMVTIPGDTFTMGCPESEKGSPDSELPQHNVTVPPFFMGKYPITQGQWRAIASQTDLKVNSDLELDPSNFKEPYQDTDRWQRPVEEVTWYQAVEFCQRLSKLTGRKYRLPSEAEWEYACRGVREPLNLEKRETYPPFYFGETITGELANYDASYTYADEPEGEDRKETTPVGQFYPNNFGLYDMHGNVWEWCADNWHENYQGAPSDGSIWEEGGNDKTKILRGGGWSGNPNSCRSASRLGSSRGSRYISVGFRVVLVLARTT